MLSSCKIFAIVGCPFSETDLRSLGAFVGCAMFEPICSRWGYKVSIYCAAFLQIIAVIGESSRSEGYSQQVVEYSRLL